MKDLFNAARVLLLDLASSLLFAALYLITDNLFLSVGVGMALGVAQIVWALAHKKTIGTMQWLSVVLILGSGTATFFTHDPHFVMIKSSVVYAIIGIVMLKRGWMNRYLPPEAEPVKDIATIFGYVWAGLMFFSAALNIELAYNLGTGTWAIVLVSWSTTSKIGLFLIQYATMNMIGRRRAKAARAGMADASTAAVI
jgi:intracellular septation protein